MAGARADTPRETPPEAWLDRCYISRTDNLDRNIWLVHKLLQLRRLDLLFSSLDSLFPQIGKLRDQRTNLVLASDGFLAQRPAQDLTPYLWGAQNGPPPVGVAGGSLRVNPRLGEDRTKPDYTACDQELLRLSSIDFERRFRELVDAARRANVAVYPVMTWLKGGVDPLAGISVFDDSAFGTLRNLADATGGLAIANDLNAGFRQIADDVSSYYLLGYTSPNSKSDGRPHRIAVKVKQPHVDVSARAGYTAAVPSSASRVAPGPPTSTSSPNVDTEFANALAMLDRPKESVVAAASAARLDAFRVAPGARAAPQPLDDLELRRTERLRLEWIGFDQSDQREIHLLGRDGKPLAVAPVLSERHEPPRPALIADLNLAPLAPGDYVIELKATVAGMRERSLFAFRVVR